MPTTTEILQVATKVIRILNNTGLSACLCGGAACVLYGCSRIPNDVDILVTNTSSSTEQIKEWIASTQSSEFFLRYSAKPGATHKILYCRTGTTYQPQECKVDILVPGVLNIPAIPSDRFSSIQNYPVMPLIPLLLLKVQTWVHHSVSTEWKKRNKLPYDVQDVDQLVRIIVRQGASLAGASSWLPSNFLSTGTTHVAQYRQGSGSSLPSGEWQRIGF